MSELDIFAAAMRAAESNNNYNQVRGRVRDARIVGAYGFAGDEWAQLAADAGLPGARWADHAAQDLVARRTFDALYRKYGDWRLVAVAWKAGEQLADAVASNPALLDAPELKEVKDYAFGVMREASGQIKTDTNSELNPRTFSPSMRGLDTSGGSETTAGQTLTGILTAMRNRRRSLGATDRDLSAEEEVPSG